MHCQLEFFALAKHTGRQEFRDKAQRVIDVLDREGGPPSRDGGRLWPIHIRPESGTASWLKVPSALFEDTAPSARLVHPRARGAPTHPRAPPEQIWSLPWSQHPASGRPKVEDVATSNRQAS